jgi:hypothetical protein
MLAAAVGPRCTGLQGLSLTIEGHLIEGGLRLLDTKAEWVKMGLESFKFLQRLELIIVSGTLQTGAAEPFKCRLIETLRGVQIVIKAVVLGNELSL